jgi:hypothetical protein
MTLRYTLWTAVLGTGLALAAPSQAIVCLEGTVVQCTVRGGVALPGGHVSPSAAMVVSYVPVLPVAIAAYPAGGANWHRPGLGSNDAGLRALQHNRSLFLWRALSQSRRW